MDNNTYALLWIFMPPPAVFLLLKYRYVIKELFWFSRKRFIFIALFLLTSLILYFDVIKKNIDLENFRVGDWGNIYSHYITFGTFIIALAAWFSVLYRDWKESLPKRLSVYFSYDNKIPEITTPR